jgi:hypothetical protein
MKPTLKKAVASLVANNQPCLKPSYRTTCATCATVGFICASIVGLFRRTGENDSRSTKRIREALNKPGRTGVCCKIAERFGVAVGTVQRISRPFEGASVGAA